MSQFALCLSMLPLNSNTLDILTKEYTQLHLLLICVVSLIGSQLMYNNDKTLCEIIDMPTRPFGNPNVIFCSDLCQVHLICDSWIFEHPSFYHDTMLYTFWIDNIECFELKQVMGQDNKDIHIHFE